MKNYVFEFRVLLRDVRREWNGNSPSKYRGPYWNRLLGTPKIVNGYWPRNWNGSPFMQKYVRLLLFAPDFAGRLFLFIRYNYS